MLTVNFVYFADCDALQSAYALITTAGSSGRHLHIASELFVLCAESALQVRHSGVDNSPQAAWKCRLCQPTVSTVRLADMAEEWLVLLSHSSRFDPLTWQATGVCMFFPCLFRFPPSASTSISTIFPLPLNTLQTQATLANEISNLNGSHNWL